MKTSTYAAVTVLTVCIFSMSALSAPAYRCTTAASPITIDGIADESAWSMADSVKIGLQAQPIIQHFGGDPVAATPMLTKYNKSIYAKALWDAEALYFYFYAENPHLWNVREGRDTAGYYNENTFEVYLDPGNRGSNYVEINVSARGDITDYYNNWPYQSRENFDIAGIESAVHYLEGTTFCEGNALEECNTDTDVGMTMELKVPFAGLGVLQMPAEAADKADTMLTITLPTVSAAAITDWGKLHEVLNNESPAPAFSALASKMDQALIESIKAAQELSENHKTAVIQSLQEAITDISALTGIWNSVTLRDTVIGEGAPAYPLPLVNFSSTDPNVIDTVPVSVDTVFKAGCSVIDSLKENPSDTVLYAATEQVLSRYKAAVSRGILDTANQMIQPGTLDNVEDTTAMRWLNVFLLEHLLFPQAIDISGALLDDLQRTLDFADGAAIPPSAQDSWHMNFNFITSPPCSLYRIDYSWAPVGNETHATDLYNEVIFVGSPVGVAYTAQTMHSRKALRIRQSGAQSVTIDYTIPAEGAKGSIGVYTLGGRRIASIPVQSRTGNGSAQWRYTAAGSGAYIVRLHNNGRAFSERLIITR